MDTVPTVNENIFDGWLDCFKGSSINDITQVGAGVCNFCDAMYQSLSKKVILAWQRGEGESENLQICVTSLMDDP